MIKYICVLFGILIYIYYITDSPMVLDTSTVEDKMLLRETVVLFVQDYDTEIYSYLRECEVSSTLYYFVSIQ